MSNQTKLVEWGINSLLSKGYRIEHPSEILATTPDFLKSLGALVARMHEVSQRREALLGREHWFEGLFLGNFNI